MSIYISGSLAYDRIMKFPGNFQDHILPEKLSTLNVSFMVEEMEERRGGCAGNIAYNLALLGETPIILSAAGKDFAEYDTFLKNAGVSTDGIKQSQTLFTATCYVTTDLQNNQIVTFYAGAMSLSYDYNFPNLNSGVDIAIVSPGNLNDMRYLPKFYRENKIPYIYDPSLQLPVLSKEDLLDGINGAFIVTSNEYELDLICHKTEKTIAQIEAKTQWLITTLGKKGTKIRGKEQYDIAAVNPTQVVDPTGAGDAQRAGLIKGIIMGLNINEAALLASTCASFALEKNGTQEHFFTKDAFNTRHKLAFPDSQTNI